MDYEERKTNIIIYLTWGLGKTMFKNWLQIVHYYPEILAKVKLYQPEIRDKLLPFL